MVSGAAPAPGAGPPPPPGLLAGVRVLDLSRVLAGPFAAQLLAEMGADVVKVEFPGGDPVRAIGPHQGSRSLYFSALNAGKRGVVLDPRDGVGRAHLDTLLAAADVVVANFRPEVARDLGLDAHSLGTRHPELVSVTVSGYASDSGRAGTPAYDVTVQAEAGIMAITGHPDAPPARAGVPISDLAAGFYAALAAVGGIVSRATTGRGRHLEVPLLDATLPLLSYMATAALHTGEEPVPVASGHHRIVPYGAYPARDGWVVVAVLADKFWPGLCEALELTDLADRADLADGEGRLRARDEVDAAVGAAVSGLTRAEAARRLGAAGVPNAPVLGLLEALQSGYVTERGLVHHLDTPEGRHGVVLGPLSAGVRLRPAPDLGEHTEAVLDEWGAAARTP